MKNIGIVCEGPTDYIILRGVIDKITGEDNHYVQLQPEPDLTGESGHGWKGVWKWCRDNAEIKDKLMRDIEPQLDILIIQIDGDVSRKEKPAHCWCESTVCEYKGIRNPLECDVKKEIKDTCPIVLPCKNHEYSVKGYMEHLSYLITTWLGDLNNTCIVIPCDSTEAWVIAAYDETEDAELVEDPWLNRISKKKYYHDIRISGNKKRVRIYEQFAKRVCTNWNQVARICLSARNFERSLGLLVAGC